MNKKEDRMNTNFIPYEKRTSPWVKSFDVSKMKPLIICRGPIRMETMDTFERLGMTGYGILLSEKDSVAYRNALAPELRKLTETKRVHRVPDYSGSSAAERNERIEQIIHIAKSNDYDSIFAGYGFMAEDEALALAIEQAGLIFIGPCSDTIRRAGLKDEAKRTAQMVDVSIVPGIDNLTSQAFLVKYPKISDLKRVVEENDLVINFHFEDKNLSLMNAATAILDASYRKGIDLLTEDEIGEQLIHCVSKIYHQYPDNRIRLKAIGGGGGKGQRILPPPYEFEGSLEERIIKAATTAPEKAREILSEVKATGPGANKNILIELNIDTTRHQEIQVVGNGEWCMTMGGRDCSLQMHEQKLVEVSLIREELIKAAKEHKGISRTAIQCEVNNLEAMEAEAARFGKAVGLDSVSTFECIVDQDEHFFMEMNTRVQVEHRVTELCYALQFTNPVDEEDYFRVHSIIELMVLLAHHGKRLPCPKRILDNNAAIEIRLNATNDALQPHAGGMIEYWSNPTEGEIRDDQGISIRNPDSQRFIKYNLAGAYDSNIALILANGSNRRDVYEKIAEILRITTLSGKDLATNLDFHYGLIHWFIRQNVYSQVTTKFVQPYLTQVGLLKYYSEQVELNRIWKGLKIKALNNQSVDENNRDATEQILSFKTTLVSRVIDTLLDRPHILSAWLSAFKPCFRIDRGKLSWIENPIRVLAKTYHFLNMEPHSHHAAMDCIWCHDQKIIQDGLEFYKTIDQIWAKPSWKTIEEIFPNNLKPKGFTDQKWEAIQGAHMGHQIGLNALLVLPYIADRAGFYQLKTRSELNLEIPSRLCDTKLQNKMSNTLVPPPDSENDQLVASSGGTFFSREAPDRPPFLKEGDHFEKGDPVYIIEVMKMFNKIHAPYAGKVEKVLVDGDGSIIKKGQPIFKVNPDKKIRPQSAESIAKKKSKFAISFLKKI